MLQDVRVRSESWPLSRPFRISRGVTTAAEVVVVEIRQGHAIGRGEARRDDAQAVLDGTELDREVAARREYELEVEAEARKRVEENSRADLAELRAELRGLRESLERLTGGEVLVERFALRAQSTRMRALAEGKPRVVPSDSRRGARPG